MTTKWIESGTSATYDTSFYSSTTLGTSGTVTSSPISISGSHRSLACANGATSSSNALANRTTIMADAGRRTTFYCMFNQNPCGGGTNVTIWAPGASAGFSLAVTSSFKLAIQQGSNINNQITAGTTTLSANTVYRISITYTITSSSVNSITVYINGVSEITVTNNASVSTGTGTASFGFQGMTSAVANSIIYFSHIYVDDGTSGDVGNVKVTAKRPYSNGTTNAYTTQVGTNGSIWGTGHAPQMNERALSTTNGWSLTASSGSQVEQFNIESMAQGDHDLRQDTIIDYTGWIDAKISVASSFTAHINVNGTTTSVTLTTSAALYTAIAGSTTYPAGTGSDIGMDCTPSASRTISFYECGIIFAYTPAAAPTLTTMSSVLFGSDAGNGGPSNAATRYAPFHVGGARSLQWNSTEANVEAVISSPGTVSNFTISASTAILTGSWAFTVFQNGSSTGITVTLSSGTIIQDNTHTITVAAGDRLTLQSVPTSTPTAASFTWSALFSGSNTNEYPLSGMLDSSSGPSNAANSNFSISTNATGSITITNNYQSFIANSPFQITKFYVYFNTSIATGTWAVNLNINGVAQASTTITITSGHSGNVTGLALNVGIGDFISITFTPTTTPTSSSVTWSLAVSPFSNYAGESVVNTSDQSTLSTTVNTFLIPSGRNASTNTTEASAQMIAPISIVVKKLATVLSATPGSAKSYTFQSRIGSSNGSMSMALTNEQNGSDMLNADMLGPMALFDTSIAPSGTPTAANSSLSLVITLAPPIFGLPFGTLGESHYTQILPT